MAAPAHELVGVATARLKAFPALTALVPASKIFYRPPASFTPPYVTVDDVSTRRDDIQCVTGIIASLTIHVWTDDSNPLPGGGGALQDARAIAWEVANALHHYPLALPNNRLVTLAHTGERVFYDADGTTGHAVVDFEAEIEAA
ncbi:MULTISPECIES: DUF3168 domain-containing protein [unclassified Mesorhizobium]|uniref:DUF3168 domain-containing protein n=1 Tax=unclassified Mesorhizobium TaxID=325217 RepID=UPI000FDC00E3|nr:MULTISPECIES: DUF3168 domain-containing protein [unclassified Mesorhizobium]TGR58259.1 DUF3168 domain-containing protein [bacterium M00.F.Ca.ET.199.01.1.1]TGU41633.1 DUF3168 domain-containing protein [bacterium M00.F.Ca.ET.156.01.1.1]TGV89743.1 DUF3168 domain-containing protein [Mesorhizobium sp. M00.F.Ca.ET.149.01.1.1]TGR33001.1 DUF3168 domain-containing protein [Mesorhizobium sp. M8A.F.Ca.ET.197.01.1.1]TGR34647.1 DUF3168 domain-containing protein [Mesorhizobium sp. M8A.F.Ca.ET.202.01.1.1]